MEELVKKMVVKVIAIELKDNEMNKEYLKTACSLPLSEWPVEEINEKLLKKYYLGMPEEKFQAKLDKCLKKNKYEDYEISDLGKIIREDYQFEWAQAMCLEAAREIRAKFKIALEQFINIENE